jgi:hypothetical protein
MEDNNKERKTIAIYPGFENLMISEEFVELQLSDERQRSTRAGYVNPARGPLQL